MPEEIWLVPALEEEGLPARLKLAKGLELARLGLAEGRRLPSGLKKAGLAEERRQASGLEGEGLSGGLRVGFRPGMDRMI